ncbi:hypothetical protein [Ruegeria conchae]|uniref:Uncharacterized protein n=2 Tax=Ruegeria conchae TaxID=981384 RepID=A0A497ZIS9_9RHOB|nr:hypothetical protein [Ruegeria conchae]RLK08551.1 hypothetical protein CLV75_2233 [Ruegeria conchae]
MTQDQSFAVVALSMLGTYGVLLAFSPRYRADTVKMFHLEKSTLRVAIEHPLATFAHFLSFVLPVYYVMGFPIHHP